MSDLLEKVFQLITPQAEKEVQALTAQNRNKIVETLLRPVRLDKCKKMLKVKSTPVWRVRVDRDLRITICEVANKVCVVHVGGHADSDHFVDHVDHGLPLHPKPLMESPIMKKTPDVADTTQPQTVEPSIEKKEPEVVHATQPVPVEPPSTYDKANDWHDKITLGITGLVNHLMDTGVNTMTNLCTDQVDVFTGQVAKVREQVNGQTETIAKLAGRINELDIVLHDAKAEQTTHTTKITAQVDGQNTTITRLQGKVNELAVGAHQGKADQAKNAAALNTLEIRLHAEVKQRSDEVARKLTTAAQERDQQIAAVNQQVNDLATVTDDRFIALAKSADTQEKRIDEVAEGVSRLGQQVADTADATQEISNRVEQVEATLLNVGAALKTLVKQQEAVMTALAELKQRDEEREAAAGRTLTARMGRMAQTVKAWFAKSPVAKKA